jgi:hypothetical protein
METTLTTAEQFFFDNAGYSWNPAIETRDEGKLRCAKAMAQAEREAAEAGFSWDWQIDSCTDSFDFSDEEPYALWICVCHSLEGKPLASLGAIDFGRDGNPWSNPYRRVVQAELALDALHFD